MDDSCQDFEDICSKLLKRVRKKQGEPRQQRKEEKQPSTRAGDGAKRNHRNHGTSGSGAAAAEPFCAGAEAGPHVNGGGPGFKTGDAGRAGGKRTAKDRVLEKMQTFKRAAPRKMLHRDRVPAHEGDRAPPPTLKQDASPADSSDSNCPLEPEDGDQALAAQLQRELDREAARAQAVDLTDGGLFFCHVCHRDLTRMTPEGRTQHVNRCLDESEGSASSAPPPPPPPPSSGVPDCPICGQKFRSPKSHSAHLKRCSSDMGVSPAALLQALRRQAEERRKALNANPPTEAAGTKRKGSAKPGVRAKKPRRRAEVLDEETMVALALSSSLYEQDGASPAPSTSHVSAAAGRKWSSDAGVTAACVRRAGAGVLPPLPGLVRAGERRRRRKKGAVPGPPPLLLVQDAAAALDRRQERVSALLLRSRPPSPPTPTRRPSSLSGWSGAAPLWQRSSLLLDRLENQFYTHELRAFFLISAAEPNDQGPPSVASVSCGCPGEYGSAVSAGNCAPPPSQPAASSAATEELPVSTQAFRDLMELAEDGMVSSQGGHSASCSNGDDLNTSLLLPSGFIQEELQDPADLGASGFLPETTRTDPPDYHTGALAAVQLRTESNSHTSTASSCLRAELGSMVNNPQLSDVQLQVDTGQVFFAHSFMLYARCPLLVEMLHENGFGAQEEGAPAARRVLISDVPGQAVLALLRYLYTADLGVPPWLRPHVLELASRLDLKPLQQLCELAPKEAASAARGEDGASGGNAGGSPEGRAFLGLLRSMWSEEEDDNEAAGADGRRDKESVNEEELEEIYEFAATQRQKNGEGEQEEEEEDNGEEQRTKLAEPPSGSAEDCEDGALRPLCSARVPPTPEASLRRRLAAKPPVGGGGVLQSSASALEDAGLPSPRSFAGALPVPGESPERGPGEGLASDGPQEEEVELIVLSDSNSPESPGANPHPEVNKHGGVERGPDRPTSAADRSPLGCSPELSWLVPSTPLQRRRSTSSSSARTRSSRAQLFPRGGAGAPVFSSPDPGGESGARAAEAEAPAGSAGGGAEVAPGRTRPHSSTPLQSRGPKTGVGLGSSPSSSDPSQRAGPGALRFSPLSDASDSPSSRLREGRQSSQRDAGRPRPRRSATGGNGAPGETASRGEEEAARPGSPRSFGDLDEPPIAFNDSWGLDLGADATEDGGGLSQPEKAAPGSRLTPPAGASGRLQAHRGSPPPERAQGPGGGPSPQLSSSLLESRVWDSWEEEEQEEEEEEEDFLPPSQRATPSTPLKTPAAPRRRRRTPVPITPTPRYSAMDTPELRHKLSGFGVRPLPKRQMVLKLKEIHRYTHQLLGSDSEDEARPAQAEPPQVSSGDGRRSCTGPAERSSEEAAELLSASQGSGSSSTAASEESERSNPELVPSSDSSSSDISASQATSSLQDRLRAVRAFILSDSELYTQILEYRPLVLTQIQGRLKAAGIRLGVSKLAEYLDSQCITFSAAKPGTTAGRRGRGRRPGRRKGVPATG